MIPLCGRALVRSALFCGNTSSQGVRPVGQGAALAGGQDDAVGFIGEFRPLRRPGGAAVPRLNAQVGGLLPRHGPEGQHGEAVEGHPHPSAAFAATQGDGARAQALEDQGVQRVKPAVVQGQGVGVLQAGQGRRPVQQSVPQQQGGTALPLGEH